MAYGAKFMSVPTTTPPATYACTLSSQIIVVLDSIRHPGQRSDPAFIIAHHTDSQPGVIVWGAIIFDNGTPMVIIRGTLTAQRYVDDVLRNVFPPFFLQYLGLIFQQNNAIPHTARVAVNCLTACQTLPWLARLPDLSPIDHV
ncbi:transposable element Tc1 transposase [Trichonephila clavipes]|nr:transposable element Tc1 transposase [Trichonephila clavipes]